VQVEPMQSMLTPAEIKRLKTHDDIKLFTSFAFDSNLRRFDRAYDDEYMVRPGRTGVAAQVEFASNG